MRTKRTFGSSTRKPGTSRRRIMFEELLEIADDGSNDWTIRTNKSGDEYEVANTEVVQRSRLRIDVRKWYLSKVLPKKFQR
jgi:hypothetical protein